MFMYLELESAHRGNLGRRSGRSVGILWLASEYGDFAPFHRYNTLVPSLYDLSCG